MTRRTLIPAPTSINLRAAQRTIKGGIGHNLPQEAPQAFAHAVLDIDGYAA